MAIRFKIEDYKHRHFLKEWREHRGLSQHKLAEVSGVSKSTISRLENYEQPYSQDLLEALGTALGTFPVGLILCDPPDSELIVAAWVMATPEQRQVMTEHALSIVGEHDLKRLQVILRNLPGPPIRRPIQKRKRLARRD